mmetsp:Transcript_4161/g.8919  ORF Transcript_4161/g.8919 Transcript_4161/m.8919 type:complete len:185 (+) Transcript_4161:226-780(+)
MPGPYVSDGSLASGVLELAQTLAKNNAQLSERKEEHARLSRISAEFKQHLAWQRQRIATLKHNLERLHNETTWLDDKSAEVSQDVRLAGVELRQVNGEIERTKALTERTRIELAALDEELRLEDDTTAKLRNVSAQAHRAMVIHSREREAYLQEANQLKLRSQRLKDRIEELAYRVNGLAAGAL